MNGQQRSFRRRGTVYVSGGFGPSLFRATALLLGLSRAALSAEPISFDALVAETVTSNPELRFYEAEIAAARGQRSAAARWANPELSSELGQKRVDDLSGNRLGDGPIWSVSIAQTFEFPGRLSLRKALANRQVELAEIGLRQFRTALAMRARSLGYRMLAGQQRAEAAAEVSKRFQDLLAVLVQRDVAGVAPMLETRIIEANAFALSRRASEASIAARNAQFELNQLRGVPISTPVDVARTAVPLPPPPPLDTLVAEAREHSFDVRTRIAELEQQGLQVKLSRNQRWPSVRVAPFVASERASDEELRFGLGVSVPLPLLNQNTGEIETARARQTQAEVLLSVALREVERKIAGARYAYETFLVEMARWPADALSKFRDAARVADEHYRLGAVPVATYTALQTQYLDAVDTLLDTQADALDVRQQLELLTGLDLAAVPGSEGTPAPSSASAGAGRR